MYTCFSSEKAGNKKKRETRSGCNTGILKRLAPVRGWSGDDCVGEPRIHGVIGRWERQGNLKANQGNHCRGCIYE